MVVIIVIIIIVIISISINRLAALFVFILSFFFVDEFVKCAEEIESLYKNDSARCSDMCRPKCRYGCPHIHFELVN